MAKYSKESGRVVESAMHRMHEGTLKSGTSGKKVTNPKQAIAIGLSEAREKGMKVPAQKSPAKKSAVKKNVVKKQSTAKKTTAIKSTAKKASEKKSTAKKPTAKKSISKISK
jgi:hypothetical protein